MMTDNTKVDVQARAFGRVGYVIPEEGIDRTFAFGEIKKIELGELKKLQYTEGGADILNNYLIIKNEEALKELNMAVEPEYFYSEDEVTELLMGSDPNTLNQLDDALTFAPEGVVDLIQSMAIKLEIPDIRKRDLITEKTGVNINEAIKANHLYDEENEEGAETAQKQRKTAPIKVQTSEPTRKSTEPVKTKTKPVTVVTTKK